MGDICFLLPALHSWPFFPLQTTFQRNKLFKENDIKDLLMPLGRVYDVTEVMFKTGVPVFYQYI